MRLRVATFNLENLDQRPGTIPSLAERIAVLRPQLEELDADVLCLQEVNAQEGKSHDRSLAALDALLDGTKYAGHHRNFTTSGDGPRPRDIHNIVTLSPWPFERGRQVCHDLVTPPRYRATTATPTETEFRPVGWDRPFLVSTVRPGAAPIHILNRWKNPLRTWSPPAFGAERVGSLSSTPRAWLRPRSSVLMRCYSREGACAPGGGRMRRWRIDHVQERTYADHSQRVSLARTFSKPRTRKLRTSLAGSDRLNR